MKLLRLPTLAACVALLALAGCATPAKRDYTAFLAAKPASMLVLPPVNDSNDVKATPAVWASATLPLAEAGYYVVPVTLVDQSFRENGVLTASDAQSVPLAKLREVFGADAAVYLRVKQYGTTYAVISSETRVTVEGKVIDLRSGTELWAGSATASSAEQNNSSSGGLIGALVEALVKQIVHSSSDAAYNYSVIADQRLLGAPLNNGILPGPRSPLFGQVPGAQK
ncbi:DUF799 domain-containing protein [Derxia gummosa]|uniref:DUF799 domain-containing protein n=1 Tax=Derxia gummosa DSM 723 TaxID=1121388 RepID=A0A8B6X5B2_9BURK|nr:DUF799 domain-containing protein [Derxia gummosa]